MTQIEIHSGFALHTAQQQIWDAFVDPTVRFIVASCGRRMGKTEAAKLMLAYVATRGLRAAYMAPTSKMMDQMWEELKMWLAPAIRAKDETHKRLDLVGGAKNAKGVFENGVIEFWSLDNPNGPRGRSYDLVVLDECALLPTARIFEAAIRPTLSDRKGKAVFLSTPRGLDWFYVYYQRGLPTPAARRKFPKWRSFQFPTSANPHIEAGEIQEARDNLPLQVFREEYLAEFLNGEDAIFRNLDKLNTGKWQDRAALGHVYMAGVDLARSQDFSVICVIDVSLMEVCHIDRSQGIEWEMQIGRLAALHEKFGFQNILVEDNAAGLPVIERMLNMALPITAHHTSNLTKMQTVNALALRLEREQLKLLDDQDFRYGDTARTLINELMAFQATRLPSGLIRYAAPDGMHDDMVSALCLANWACEGWSAGEATFYRFGHGRRAA